jgi:hypothetical protein
MWLSTDLLRYLLLGCILGMACLAAFYLRRRELTPHEYLGWGLLALLLPLIGPFLVILSHPGTLRKELRLPRTRRTKKSASRFFTAR